jgi:hypothetical protein
MHASFLPPAALAPVLRGGQDALAFLAATHDELRQALDTCDCALPAPTPMSREEVVELCLALKIHGMLERELVHPTARAVVAHDALLDRAEADHEEVQQLIEALLALDPAEARARERLHALHRTVDRQFEEAEIALFTRLAVSDLDLDELGRRLAARWRDILAELGLAADNADCPVVRWGSGPSGPDAGIRMRGSGR